MKFFLVSLLLCLTSSIFAQVGIGIAVPNPSAELDVTSTNRGFLPPRMTMAQRDLIVGPAAGLMIFCTDCISGGVPIFYNGTRWISMIPGPYVESIDIGTQTWQLKNLNVSRYRNGDVIPQVTDPTAWNNLTTGAWCWYNNDSASYAATYGKLYNWYAVNDPRGLAPLGWHIPTDAEWTMLTDYLGGTAVAGGFMKQTGTNLWIAPNTGATNTSSFSGLPGGYRAGVSFYTMGYLGNWWSASEYVTSYAWSRSMSYTDAIVVRNYSDKFWGFSVRCVRD